MDAYTRPHSRALTTRVASPREGQRFGLAEVAEVPVHRAQRQWVVVHVVERQAALAEIRGRDAAALDQLCGQRRNSP